MKKYIIDTLAMIYYVISLFSTPILIGGICSIFIKVPYFSTIITILCLFLNGYIYGEIYKINQQKDENYNMLLTLYNIEKAKNEKINK